MGQVKEGDGQARWGAAFPPVTGGVWVHRGGRGGEGGLGGARGGSGRWKTTIGQKLLHSVFTEWAGRDSVVQDGFDSGARAAGVGVHRGLLEVGRPGTIWKTSASFVRATAMCLELGSDGVSV